MKRTTTMRKSGMSPLLAGAVSIAAFTAYACYPSPAGTLGDRGGATGSSGGSGTDGGATSSGGGDGGGGTGSPTSGGSTAATRRIRRLTRAEYTNTLKDLLGTTTNYGATLPADPQKNGFDNDSDALEVNQLFADEARINAETISASYDWTKIGCSPSGGASCAEQFAQTFGKKAYRRPLTPSEVAAFSQLFTTVSQAASATTGMQAVLEAMLQSPNFLYKTELGDSTATTGTIPLTAWEVASELSYLFWRTMPDAELIQHAEAGDLSTPSVVAAEATRLLADPRANRMLDAFVDEWLGTGLLPYAEKDPTAFPTFTPTVAADMAGEVHVFFESSARDPKGSIAGMLTSTSSYLTPTLAQFYGVTIGTGAPVSGFVPSTMPANRHGLLTLGANLATQATPLAGNPVRRGKVVREQFFCQTMPPPPSNVAAVVPPLDPNTANKDTWLQHTKDPACSGCHTLMDPIGFGFDAFDAVGRLLPGAIDSTGSVSGTKTTDGNFDGGVDLESQLASSDEVQACFVKQWVRFGFGTGDNAAATSETTRILGTFPKGAAGVQSILQAITSGPNFLTRQAEVIPPNSAAIADAAVSD